MLQADLLCAWWIHCVSIYPTSVNIITLHHSSGRQCTLPACALCPLHGQAMAKIKTYLLQGRLLLVSVKALDHKIIRRATEQSFTPILRYD